LLFNYPVSRTVAKHLRRRIEYPGSRLKNLRKTKDVGELSVNLPEFEPDTSQVQFCSVTGTPTCSL